MSEKFCSRCQITKPVSAFSRHAKTKDHLQVFCKECFHQMHLLRYKRRRLLSGEILPCGTKKRCACCGAGKLLSEFRVNPRNTSGLRSYCIPCEQAKYKAELEKARNKPETLRQRFRSAQLRFYFGISLEEFNAMLVKQNKLCAICGQPETALHKGKPRSLSVDHDHQTGKVRELLCNNCNRGLGAFRDDPAIIDKAIAYLHRHGR